MYHWLKLLQSSLETGIQAQLGIRVLFLSLALIAMCFAPSTQPRCNLRNYSDFFPAGRKSNSCWNRPSALSEQNFRVDGLEFAASVFDIHLPVNAALGVGDVAVYSVRSVKCEQLALP